MKTMNCILLAFCIFGVLPATATAQEAQQKMDRMAGVYKHRFKNASYAPGAPGDSESYDSENVIEIVPFDANHLYVRAHLEFYNGHQCGIAGIARFEGGMFVYREPERYPEGLVSPEPPCLLRVGIDGGKLVLTVRDKPDGASSCQMHCGARGNLAYEIDMNKRRPIRYMERLKASREYKQAVEDLRVTEPPAR